MSKSRATLRLQYEVIVRDAKGKVTLRRKKVSKSFVANFTRWLRSWFTITAYTGNATSWTMTDTGNTSRTFPNTSPTAQGEYGFYMGLVNTDTFGIVVGTSATAVSPADYNLIGKIAHGTGAGQLVHGAQTIEALEIVDNTSRFRNTRVFTNNSGGLITVREIGVIFGMRDTTPAVRYILAIRDVLSPAVDVPDGNTLTVRYTISVTA